MSVRVASDSNSASLSAENRAVPFKTSAMDGPLSVIRKSRLGWPRAHRANPFDHVAAPRIALSLRADEYPQGRSLILFSKLLAACQRQYSPGSHRGVQFLYPLYT